MRMVLVIFIIGRHMVYFGVGHCDRGYYAGWDGLGTASEEDCQNLCMLDAQCKYAAYMNLVDQMTCSRYNTDICNLDTSYTVGEAHKTFEKKGLFLKNIYMLVQAIFLPEGQ